MPPATWPVLSWPRPLGAAWARDWFSTVGLVLTAVAIAASGLTTSFAALLVFRFMAGLTGALAFVCGAALISAAGGRGPASRAATLLAVYFSGAGLGVTASALAIPPLLATKGWRSGWLVLGGMAVAATVYGGLAANRIPQPANPGGRVRSGGWSPRFMTCTLVAYSLYGAGYIAYATFIIAYLRNVEGFNNVSITAFWAGLGLAAVATAFGWGPILGRLKGGRGAAATIGTVASGAALPLFWSNPGGAYVSSILFGSSFVAVIAAVTSFARRAAKPHAWTTVIAALTTAFGVGQCIGPVLSGILSDGPNGVRAGLWLSVGILIVATCVAALQPEPSASQGEVA